MTCGFRVCLACLACLALAGCSTAKNGTTIRVLTMVGPMVNETGLKVGLIRETRITTTDDCVNILIIKGNPDPEALRPFLVDPAVCLGEIK